MWPWPLLLTLTNVEKTVKFIKLAVSSDLIDREISNMAQILVYEKLHKRDLDLYFWPCSKIKRAYYIFFWLNITKEVTYLDRGFQIKRFLKKFVFFTYWPLTLITDLIKHFWARQTTDSCSAWKTTLEKVVCLLFLKNASWTVKKHIIRFFA